MSSDFSGMRKPYDSFKLQLQFHLGNKSSPLLDFVIEGICILETGVVMSFTH